MNIIKICQEVMTCGVCKGFYAPTKFEPLIEFGYIILGTRPNKAVASSYALSPVFMMVQKDVLNEALEEYGFRFDKIVNFRCFLVNSSFLFTMRAEEEVHDLFF